MAPPCQRLTVSKNGLYTKSERPSIPSIASRLDILADIADQMDQNEENTNHNQQQQLFLKYFIESIQKQQDRPVDFSTKITEQSSLSIQNKHNKFTPHASDNLLYSNAEFLKQFYERIQQVQEHIIDTKQQDSIPSPVSTNSIPLKKRYRSETSSPDAYSERRRKNNEAAKRSRDTRRAKEDEIAIRATWLEQENVKLRLENAHLKQENVQLRCQFYSSIESTSS